MKEFIFKVGIFLSIFIYTITVVERLILRETTIQNENVYIEEKQEFKNKVKEQENEIEKDSIIIFNSDRAKRDSLRAKYNPAR